MRWRAARSERGEGQPPRRPPFEDRADAGRQLAARLDHLKGQAVTVLGLPRGGVAVAAQVAVALLAPLDASSLSASSRPSRPELAVGALAEGGVRVLDAPSFSVADLSPAELQTVELLEQAQLSARVTQLRRGRAAASLAGRVAVVVDDGLATGLTARAACLAARQRHASRVVLAVPVGPADAARRVPEADEVVCLLPIPQFTAVSPYYADFRPTPEEEVVELLEAAAQRITEPTAEPC